MTNLNLSGIDCNAILLSSDSAFDFRDCWVVSTSSNIDICNDIHAFDEYRPFKRGEEPITYVSASKEAIYTLGRGTINMMIEDNMELSFEAFYNPFSPTNVFSLLTAKESMQMWYCGRDDTLRETSDDSVVAHPEECNGVLVLPLSDQPFSRVAVPKE